MFGELKEISAARVDALHNVFMPDGALVVVSVSDLEQFTQNELSYFCFIHGLYGIITDELIQDMRHEIDGRRAIEIGAGCGLLGAALGIISTDNFEKETTHFIEAHKEMGQPIAPYGANVEKLDAIEAIKKYKPEVVVASWVTQSPEEGERMLRKLSSAKRRELKALANEKGLNFRQGIYEDAFHKLGVQTYVKYGNIGTHGKDRIRDLPFWDCYEQKSKTYYSRSLTRENNRLWILDRK